MGGSPKRMLQFANYIKEEIGYELPAGMKLHNISETSDRYGMKVKRNYFYFDS